MSETETPRTDAEASVNGRAEMLNGVRADFARTLERELTAAQAEVAGLKQSLAASKSTAEAQSLLLDQAQESMAREKQAAEGLRAALQMTVDIEKADAAAFEDGLSEDEWKRRQALVLTLLDDFKAKRSEALAAAPAPGWSHPDTKRLDWMERKGHALEWDDMMRAFVEGKPIEFRRIDTNAVWSPSKTGRLAWNWEDYDYRVAPVPLDPPGVVPLRAWVNPETMDMRRLVDGAYPKSFTDEGYVLCEIRPEGYTESRPPEQGDTDTLRELFRRRNHYNRNIRDALVKLFTEHGWQEDCTLINQLTCMNFDDGEYMPPKPDKDGVWQWVIGPVREVAKDQEPKQDYSKLSDREAALKFIEIGEAHQKVAFTKPFTVGEAEPKPEQAESEDPPRYFKHPKGNDLWRFNGNRGWYHDSDKPDGHWVPSAYTLKETEEMVPDGRVECTSAGQPLSATTEPAPEPLPEGVPPEWRYFYSEREPEVPWRLSSKGRWEKKNSWNGQWEHQPKLIETDANGVPLAEAVPLGTAQQ